MPTHRPGQTDPLPGRPPGPEARGVDQGGGREAAGDGWLTPSSSVRRSATRTSRPARRTCRRAQEQEISISLPVMGFVDVDVSLIGVTYRRARWAARGAPWVTTVVPDFLPMGVVAWIVHVGVPPDVPTFRTTYATSNWPLLPGRVDGGMATLYLGPCPSAARSTTRAMPTTTRRTAAVTIAGQRRARYGGPPAGRGGPPPAVAGAVQGGVCAEPAPRGGA